MDTTKSKFIMLKSTTFAASLALIAAIVTTVAWASHPQPAEDGEQIVATNELPEAVRGALVQHAGTGKFDRVIRKEGLTTIYEATWTKDGQTHEATMTLSGDLMETEVTIPREEAPKAIQAVADDAMPSNAKIEYEKKTLVLYSIEADINGKITEVLLLPTGQRVKDIQAVDAGEKRGSDDND